MSDPSESDLSHRGTVVSVRGSVVDARFPGELPFLNSLLRAGEQGHVAIEVQAHLNAEVIRGVALTLTQGLGRGCEIVDTGETIKVPVGKSLLGRVSC